MAWWKWIDLPPVWLAAHVAIAYAVPRGFQQMPWVGATLMLAALALMGSALLEMRRARTTPIPHMQPDALVTTGVFGVSRNPIYLGDVVFLAGASLYLGSLVGVIMIAALIWILQRRFILPEESRLRAKFGQNFKTYATKTRRWL